MSEYIKKEDAIASIQAHDPVPEARGEREWAEYLLEDVVSADVVEVRHGKWLPYDDGLHMCGVCGFTSHRAYDKVFKYCPNCGARMDGERDERK